LEEFADLVKDALLHLYDVAYLQRHPLAALVEFRAGEDSPTRAKVLLRTLLQAVESLRPPAGTSSDSRAWRSYRILEMRYLEGLSVGHVIDRLAISKTQYQRDHARALEAIASLLSDAIGESQSRPVQPAGDGDRYALAVTEVEDLTGAMSEEPIDLEEALAGLIPLFGNSSNGKPIAFSAPVGLPKVHADRVALRQIFLTLLQIALGRKSVESLRVRSEFRDPWVTLIIEVMPAEDRESGVEAGPIAEAELEVVRRLADAMGGKLAVTRPGERKPWSAAVTLPAAQRPTVLVLDNHPDFINLVQRYLAADGWIVVGATDVGRAQALLAERCPDAILLDVMMPGQDGWDLLISLNAQPETRRIPVVVCSVLYEPEVARALGAVSYLPKPVSQEALLAVLAPYRRRAGELAPSPRR